MPDLISQDSLGAFLQEPRVFMAGADAGPLHGLSCAVKDVFDLAGFHTGAGNPDWLRTHPPAPGTAPAVQAILAAGASVVGKTHTDELTYSLNGENHHYGTPANPNAPDRVPGGSSSGSASAVAGGLVNFALGTDTGGSVRLPASNCGIFGFRPTHGRIDNSRVVPLAPSFDTVGWFTRDAGLLSQVGQALLGTEAPSSTASNQASSKLHRLLYAEDAFDLAFAEVRPAFKPALSQLSGHIGKAQIVNLCGGQFDSWTRAFRLLQGVEVWNNFGPWVRATRPVFGPDTHARFEWAASLDSNEVPAANKVREQVRQLLDDLLGAESVLCIPTSPGIALLKNASGEELERFRHRALSLLCLAGLAGLPQVSLPLGIYDGCPLGISLIAPRGSDEQLLGLISALKPLPENRYFSRSQA